MEEKYERYTIGAIVVVKDKDFKSWRLRFFRDTPVGFYGDMNAKAWFHGHAFATILMEFKLPYTQQVMWKMPRDFVDYTDDKEALLKGAVDFAIELGLDIKQATLKSIRYERILEIIENRA